MDRTGIIALLACVAAFCGLQWYVSKYYPDLPAKAPLVASAPAPAPSVASPTLSSPVVAVSHPTEAAPVPTISAQPEKVNVLENDYLRATCTTQGASIKQIELKKHKEGEKGNVTLNEDAHNNIMALTGWPGADTTTFQVQSAPQSLTYTATLPDGVQWTRTYTLGTAYSLSVKDTLANPSGAEVVMPAYSIAVGRAEPLLVHGAYQPISNQYLGAGWLTTRPSFHLTTINDFNPSGMISTRPARDLFTTQTPDNNWHIFLAQDLNPLRWLAVENQFFAVLLTPGSDHLISQATFRCFNDRPADGYLSPQTEPNIEAFADFPEVHLPAGKALDLNYSLYAGPKEHGRLSALGENQGELMNYGMFVVIIAPMLSILHFFYGVVHNYGVAIILLTLCVKAVTWPLQSIANHSGKRMQAVAPKLKDLKEKYKDQPEKLNTETFALYKEYGVNPLGGCLPAFVQMPVFFSLYFMLQNAVELRGQSFLWVHDLTQPDTVLSYTLPFVIPFLNTSHLMLNPLPLIVTGLTMVMMRMTPQIGDPQQAKIAQFMPLIFLFIFYNFAAGLSLYYVINNCVSIIQIYRNLRKPLPELKRKAKKA
jgi:YidC/Oxa1 family membrane protein insertase